MTPLTATARRFLASPSLTLPACLLTLLAILAYRFGWFWFVVLCLAIAAAPWFAAARLLDRIAELESETERLNIENDSLNADNMQMAARLAELEPVPFVPVERPRLHVVPAQRGPVPVADEPTPIHDRALIDAWIEDVQAWGTDADS